MRVERATEFVDVQGTFDPAGADREPSAPCACESEVGTTWSDFAMVAGVLALVMQVLKT